MKAKSIHAKSPDEIKVALETTMLDGYKPTLALIFTSVLQDRHLLCKVFDDAEIAVYGTTTNGEFTDQGILSGSIAILLLDLNPDYFTILLSPYPEKNYREIAQEMAREALEKFSNPCFLIAASNMETDAEELMHGFEDVIGKHVHVYGGMAGDDFKFTDQYVFTNSESSNIGVVALVFDENRILIKGKATCGWKPMGTEKTVTKSDGNHVYTIDDISPLEMTKKYSGLENLNPENPLIQVEISTSFPLQLQRDKGAAVMRPGLVVDWNDGSFICSGSVPEGSKIKFSLPPDFDVVEEVIAGCNQLKESDMPDADALVIFSCAGRLISLGPLINEEIDGVAKVWNVPMAGMFSNAEMARATGGDMEMHNLTTCCVVLKEK